MWSAEKRAEGLEYMHSKPSSHSGRIVRDPPAIDDKLQTGFHTSTTGVRGICEISVVRLALRAQDQDLSCSECVAGAEPVRPLFLAQRLQRIDFGGPARGYVAG